MPPKQEKQRRLPRSATKNSVETVVPDLDVLETVSASRPDGECLMCVCNEGNGGSLCWHLLSH